MDSPDLCSTTKTTQLVRGRRMILTQVGWFQTFYLPGFVYVISLSLTLVPPFHPCYSLPFPTLHFLPVVFPSFLPSLHPSILILSPSIHLVIHPSAIYHFCLSTYRLPSLQFLPPSSLFIHPPVISVFSFFFPLSLHKSIGIYSLFSPVSVNLYVYTNISLVLLNCSIIYTLFQWTLSRSRPSF